MIFALFPHPGRLRALAVPLWLYQRSGLRSFAHRAGLLKILPPRLRAMDALLPEISLTDLRASMPLRIAAEGKPRLRVGLLLGCVQSVFFAGVNAATARVLAAEGCEVVIPRGQGCCGALMMHAGLEEDGLDRARSLIDVFGREQVETIVTNAAGCGSRSEEHTSELQSRLHLVCRLLLEKKKNSYRVWNQQQLPILKRVNINVASYWCPQTVSRMRQPQVAALSAEHTRQLLEASPRGYGY